MELTKVKSASRPWRKDGADHPPGVVQAIVRQLYDEIRRCRLKGTVEADRRDDPAGREHPAVLPFGLNAAFRKVDLEYERKTGVPALSKGANRSGGRPRKGTERTA